VRRRRSADTQSWLCPTELDRGRVVDAHPRVRNIRLVGLACLGAAAIAAAPWVGWWVLIPFSIAAVNLISVEQRLLRSTHPERVSVWAMVTTLLLLGFVVGLTGGPRSPALSWMVLPGAITAARFGPQVVVVGLALTAAAIVAATLGAHPAQTVNDPVLVIATLALLGVVISIVWALQAAELHHRAEATIDPLTKLLNRHALGPRFVEIAHQARLADEWVCLLAADVDHFKSVNDGYGHNRGDAVLRDIAYELRNALRSFELIYRVGGEELLILLPGTGERAGVEVAERLRGVIEQARPGGVAVTISLGVSAARGEDVDYETLARAADQALYQAKRAGRNTVVSSASAGEPDDQGPDGRPGSLLASLGAATAVL
jgi:diguanylate cyclase (GGDEF)-like protein